jgi:hypothetical protein
MKRIYRRIALLTVVGALSVGVAAPQFGSAQYGQTPLSAAQLKKKKKRCIKKVKQNKKLSTAQKKKKIKRCKKLYGKKA